MSRVIPNHFQTVLLIQAPTPKWYREGFERGRARPPLGLLSLATFLREHGHDVHLWDLLAQPSGQQAFVSRLKGLAPDVVGLSVYTECFDTARELSRVVRETLPECVIIWGGPFPTFEYEDALLRGGADYVVRYEGELTTLELLRVLGRSGRADRACVKGIAYQEDGKVVATAYRELIRDLDTLPLPDRALLTRDGYGLFFTVCGSRGCPARCTFCSSRAMWGGSYRNRSPQNVLDELAELRQLDGMDHFSFADVTFTSRASRVHAMCQLLSSQLPGVTWACEARADQVGPKQLEIMWNAGCRKLEVGVESGDDQVLASINKDITLRQIEEALAVAAHIGYETTCCFILGHPSDTLQSMRRTVALAAKAHHKYGCRVLVSYNVPFPGTYQYRHADKIGLHIHAKRWGEYSTSNPIVSTARFSRDDLRNMYIEMLQACAIVADEVNHS